MSWATEQGKKLRDMTTKRDSALVAFIYWSEISTNPIEQQMRDATLKNFLYYQRHCDIMLDKKVQNPDEDIALQQP